MLPLAVIFLTVGVSAAIVGPFLALFLSTEVHVGSLRMTGYLVAVPLASVLVSSLVARLSDRWPIRRRVLLAAATAGLVHAALFALIRQYWVLLGLAVTVGAVSRTLYPQAFAYAREAMGRDDPKRAAAAISSLRTVFSGAWVAGPPLAAFILDAGGFTAVYGAAAAMYAVSVAVAFFLLKDVPKAELVAPGPEEAQGAGDAPALSVWLTSAGFTLLSCVGFLGVQAMPLLVTQELHGAVRDSGLVLGVCAALEIPLMLGFGALSTRMPLSRLILAGTAAGVVYYALAALAGQSWHLGVLQLFNAVFIASWGGLGIAYVQDMMPGRPGRATTMFTNTQPIGAILAAPILGAAQQFGFRQVYAIGAVLCAVGLGLLALGRPHAAPLEVDAGTTVKLA